MTFGEFIWNIGDQIGDALGEINLYRKKDKGLKCIAKVIKPNHKIEPYPALLTDDRQWIMVPNLKRMFRKPVIYDEEGKQVVYIPEHTYGNIDHTKFINVANAQTSDAEVRWKHMRKWVTTTIKDIRGTIDWNLADNDFSPDFSSQSYDVLQSKSLSFLMDVPNSKMLITIIASVLLGMFLGSIIMSVVAKAV